MSPKLVISNISREMMAVWREANGSQSQRGIFAQRVDSIGNRLWGDNGVPVVDMNSSYDYLDVSVSEFDDEIIITYLEQSSNMNGDVFSKRLDSLGNETWEDGLVVITGSNDPKSDLKAEKGSNCLFISWSENGSIYAHCLRDDGSLGPPDIIPSVDCDSGYVEIDGLCFYEDDLAVLQNMIDNSYESGIDLGCEEEDAYCGSPNPYMDDPESWFLNNVDGEEYNFADGDSIVEPLELGIQEWVDGRLTSIMCGAYIYCQLSGPIPSNINDLTEIDQFRFEGNYFSEYIPETICELNIDHEDGLLFDLSWNLLCPPYPSCIEENVGEQDIADCEQVSTIDGTIPNSFELKNAYPNPFNPVTTIGYIMPEDGLVNITIFDMMGREINTILNSPQLAGYRSIQWDATNDQGAPVSAGIYLYRIRVGDFIQTKKMILLK